MKDKFYILLLLLGSLCVTSCVDEIDTRSGNEKPTLVLESYLIPNSGVNEAFLSTSVVVNSRNQEFEFPENATIFLKESTGVEVQLEYQGDHGHYAETDLEIKEGETYEISASLPDGSFDIAFGETTIPESVEILEVDLLEEKIEVDRPNGLKGYQYNVAITIEESTAPTYFHLFPSAKVYEGEDSVLVSDDFEPFDDFNFALGGGNACHDIEHLGGILINQSKLENNQFFVSFYTNPTFDFDTQFIDSISFELRTVEESYYTFHLATSKQIRAQQSSGGQPVASYTNITNGLGVVSSYNPSSVEISVK